MSLDKVCVVTGASSGIGEATARALAAAGARVVLAARREERLKELAAEIKGGGGTALPVRCDVTHKKDLESLRDTVNREFGGCDVLVNNAGIPGGGWFADIPLAQLDRVTATNYVAVLRATKLFLPLLLEAKGQVINVGSLAGRYALPGSAAYSAAKHAVVALSESLYHELKPQGVMVTVVNPGLVETEGFPHHKLLTDRRLAPFVISAEKVAKVIVDCVKRRRGPEVSVPRWQASGQAFRVLAPALYRAALSRLVGDRATPYKAR